MVRATTLSLVLCALVTTTFSHAAAAAAAASPSVHASVSAESLEALPRFDVPSFDYRSLRDGDTPHRVLQALERDGILALRNVPNYARLRERYLTSAITCALASEHDESASFVSIKMFTDGTKRLTLEATAGRELEATSAANAAVADKCPMYHALHNEFSRTLEHAVTTFGDALDRSGFVANDGDKPIAARKLVADAVRLDHLHVYESRQQSVRRARSSTELSLPLHEDHGLFIAMAAPMFFRTTPTGAVEPHALDSDATGLVIRTATNRTVRPVLKDDEVVLMVGTGASQWLATSHRIPAVLHGMRMPDALAVAHNDGTRTLRAWFGKMTLLPSYQRVLASRESFGAFTNRTMRYVRERRNAASDDLPTIGCASSRRLHDSGGRCAYRKCTLKTDPNIVPPTVGCSHACNYGTEFFDAKCAKKCDCEPQPLDGVICWMLCTARFPADECPLEQQVCDGLQNTCTLPTSAPVSPPSAPPTVTPAPSTSTPTTTPVPTTTPEPTTTTPLPTTAIPTPSTDAPIPSTPAIATPVPSTPTPAASLEPTVPSRGQC